MVRTRKKSDSGGMTATDPNVEIDIPIDGVTTTSMSVMNDAWKARTETGMNETIPRNTTREGTTIIKETRTSNAIKREDISAEKSVGRQPKITTKGQV